MERENREDEETGQKKYRVSLIHRDANKDRAKDERLEEVDVVERAASETLLMMYRWPVSLPSPHQ